MNEQIVQALKQDRVIDITTTGRKTGQHRRIEIWFHNLADRIFITGMPGRRRSWYANLVANPDFIFHLKESVRRPIWPPRPGRFWLRPNGVRFYPVF